MEIKAPNPSEWSKVENFLNTNLRKNVDWSIGEEYPLAFDEKNRGNLRIAWDANTGVGAHAALKPLLVKTPYHIFKVGVIGSVCTDPVLRGQGLARQVIDSCLEGAKNQDCDIAILWSDLFPFYEKMGFEGVGTEIHLSLPAPAKHQPPATRKILSTRKVSPQALLNLYNRHNLRSFRTVDDVRKHLEIPNSQIYTSWNPSTGALDAYCVVGKGADFDNYVHEWGGGVSSIVELLQHIRKDRSDLSLIAPKECRNLIDRLKKHGAKEVRCILGMIKIVNPETFCKRIKKGARFLGYENFIFEHKDGQTYFGHGDEIYETDKLQDIVRLAFGPQNPKDLYDFSPEALEILDQIFPIPFWVWGWDSI